MKRISLLTLVALMGLVTGCTTYSSFVQDDLKIPYVYIPPNNADHPFTLFLYTKESNFQAVCPATLLTGLTEEQLLAVRKASDIATIGIKKSEAAKFSVKMEKGDIGALDAKYARINKVELSLDNGKLYAIPNVRISDVLDRIDATSCKEDARIYLTEMPDAKFYIPTTLFAYDLRYHIYTEDGAEVTAELPAKLTKVVLAKIGLTHNSTSEMNMAGRDLYIGFRGTPINASLGALLNGGNKSMHALESRTSNPQVIDVTNLIR